MAAVTNPKRSRQSRSARTGRRGSRLHFTVDAALFRELGERLVGKPHIALAELIKNAYDADATFVRVRFADDRIEVTDNGNGMTFEEFEGFWMRIGSPHKQKDRDSPRFHRPLTGSKGVGRLAVQFLASELELRTTARARGAREIRAWVDWSDAVRAREATRATARYDEAAEPGEYSQGSRHGTTIVLTGLKHYWEPRELEALAREIWWLQPPFLANPYLKADAEHAFQVHLEHEAKGAAQRFDEQMRAVLDLWHAKLVGKLSRSVGRGARAGRVGLTLEFEDGERTVTSYEIPNCALAGAEFEVRVYALASRQRSGVKVEHAREYFRDFGGVHVYDAGFHLPYYGPDTDWLRIEIDHSHRLSRSKLLPAALQVANGMNNLPTQSRIFGVVHVDTAAEQEAGQSAHRRDFLKIQVSRDRLVDNLAFEQLQNAVRWALDFYAMQETRRKVRETESRHPSEPGRNGVVHVKNILEQHRTRIPKQVYSTLHAGVADAVRSSAAQADTIATRMGLLGALATAGISAIASDRELSQQMVTLEVLADRLDQVAEKASAAVKDELGASARELRSWMRRARATRAIFGHLVDEQNRGKRVRFRARALIQDVADQVDILLRNATVEASGVAASLRLPPATQAEWSGIFQNVFLNAAEALREADVKEIVVSSRTRSDVREIFVQDTGVGVDLSEAERLFEPFTRGSRASRHRRASAHGGTGLGLTIVRMIASSIGCQVAFVDPDPGFTTAFQLSWTETE